VRKDGAEGRVAMDEGGDNCDSGCDCDRDCAFNACMASMNGSVGLNVGSGMT